MSAFELSETPMKRLCPTTDGLRMMTACLCFLTAPVFAADQVTRQSDGDIVRGQLQTLSRTLIEVRKSNDDIVAISPDDIRDIRFDREPPALQTARSNERAGEYAAAISQLQELLDDYSGDDNRVVTELEFLMARCQARQALAGRGDLQTAIDSLRQFLQTHANSYRSLEATLLQAQLLASKDVTRAAPLLDQLRNSGVDGFAMLAGVIQGQALLEEGDAEQALAAFDDVIRRTTQKPEARSALFDSRIGRAASLRTLQRFDEALETLKAVIADLPEEEHDTLARAWNQIGDCQRDNNNPKAALLAYLHVDILYADAAAAHAEALFRLVPLWDSTGHPDRARDAASRLQADYSESVWARQSNN